MPERADGKRNKEMFDGVVEDLMGFINQKEIRSGQKFSFEQDIRDTSDGAREGIVTLLDQGAQIQLELSINEKGKYILEAGDVSVGEDLEIMDYVLDLMRDELLKRTVMVDVFYPNCPYKPQNDGE